MELCVSPNEDYRKQERKSHTQLILIVFSFSLSYILNGMNQGNASKDNENSKLFRIKLELWENQLNFIPSLTNENDKDSFMHTIKSLIKDICSVSHQIDRIAQPISECSSAKRTYQSKHIHRVYRGYLDKK